LLRCVALPTRIVDRDSVIATCIQRQKAIAMPNGQMLRLKSPGGTIGRMDVGQGSLVRTAIRRCHSEPLGRHPRHRQIVPGRDRGGGTRDRRGNGMAWIHERRLRQSAPHCSAYR